MLGVELRGDVKTEITAKVKNISPCMVVVGYEAETGTVGEYLLHNLHVPVVVVRLPSSDANFDETHG
jgi:hypothetical protein